MHVVTETTPNADTMPATIKANLATERRRGAKLRIEGLVAAKMGALDSARRMLESAAYAYTLALEHSWAAQTYLELSDLEDKVPDNAASHQAAYNAMVSAAEAGDKIRLAVAMERMYGVETTAPANVVREAAA